MKKQRARGQCLQNVLGSALSLLLSNRAIVLTTAYIVSARGGGDGVQRRNLLASRKPSHQVVAARHLPLATILDVVELSERY